MEGTVTNTPWQLPITPFRARLLGRLSLRYQTTDVAKILNKNGLRLSNEYRLCHSSANFEMSAKIMLVSSNYAKNYASTIYIIIWLVFLGDIVFRPECCDPICRCLFTCLFRDVHLYIILELGFQCLKRSPYQRLMRFPIFHAFFL